LILGLWFVPASIAVSEFFLSIAGLTQIVNLLRRKARVVLPTCFWFWLVWAVLELVVWILSPDPAAGWSEIRHLLLLAVVFLALSAFNHAQQLVMAWKGIFVSATISSVYLIGEFFYRLHRHSDEIAAGGDTSFYLRSGGLVHHWMVYGTIEILVVAGLIGFWSVYETQRRWLWPLIVINAVAVVLSLTRMTWLACLLLLAIGLVWRRSKWIWVLPMVPIGLYVIAPDAVRSRAASFLNLGYYSNAERLQMIEVGWRMVQDRPLTGVGPGRVEELYTAYLKPGEPVPAYRGHLHNNMAQIAAMFGIPVTLAALLFVAFAFRDLIRARRKAFDPDSRFLSDTAVLALIGFLFAGLFEYTYGHALGLIMIAFAVFPALSVGDLDYEMRSKDAGLLTFNRSRSSPASDH
jgi:O-antigen ligase